MWWYSHVDCQPCYYSTTDRMTSCQLLKLLAPQRSLMSLYWQVFNSHTYPKIIPHSSTVSFSPIAAEFVGNSLCYWHAAECSSGYILIGWSSRVEGTLVCGTLQCFLFDGDATYVHVCTETHTQIYTIMPHNHSKCMYTLSEYHYLQMDYCA
jgi:hypothetical protein